MNDPILGLDHVQVAAPPGCEDDARHFYGGLLGLEERAKPTVLARRGGVWFRAGAHELHIGVAPDFAPATKAHPAFRIASVDVLREIADRLAREGTDVVWADPDEIPGTERFHVHDPWGNRLELVAHVAPRTP
jgi:catechol 2,3-dioxygenase-like lactoylglutathione lyase family enzyme